MNAAVDRTAIATRLAERMDPDATRTLTIRGASGGVAFDDMGKVMEFAKMMAVADIGVPKHLRGNPGACLAVTMQAIDWQITPFQAANKSYSVNDRLAYESQLLHAVMLARAPIRGRTKCEYTGEGNTRQIRVWCELRDEPGEIVEYLSTPIGVISPKNSPLWKTDPDQQLFYFACRALIRRHFPDILLGVYARDELEDSPIVEDARADRAAAGNRLSERLGRSESTAGFSEANVAAAIDGEAIDRDTGEVTTTNAASNEAAKIIDKPLDGEIVETGARAAEEDQTDYAAELAAFDQECAAYKTSAELAAFSKEVDADPDSFYSRGPADVREKAEAIYARHEARLAKAEKTAVAAAASDAPDTGAEALSEPETGAADASGDDDAELTPADRLLAEGRGIATNGVRKLKSWLGKLNQKDFELVEPHKPSLIAAAKAADDAEI